MATEDLYRERLLPSWWAWLIALSFVGMLAVAYGAALGTRSGVIVGIVGVVFTCWLLWLTAPKVRVTAAQLEVDDARLPRSSIGEVSVADREAIGRLRGPGSDARLFVALRPWSARNAVLVRLDDPDDPHPAWLFSSRHPARVLDALTGTMSSSEH